MVTSSVDVLLQFLLIISKASSFIAGIGASDVIETSAPIKFYFITCQANIFVFKPFCDVT